MPLQFLKKLHSLLTYFVFLFSLSALFVSSKVRANAEIVQPFDVSSGGYVSEVVDYQGALYLSAQHGAVGRELWRYDGTKLELVTDIEPGTDGSQPVHLVVYNNKLYFFASTPAAGTELMVYDGQSVAVAYDLYPGTRSSNGRNLLVWNNKLYFIASSDTSDTEIFSFDGSNMVQETKLVTGSGNTGLSRLTLVNNQLYFSASNGVSGFEPWRFDGTSAVLLADINNGGSSYPKNFTAFNNKVYFSANDGIHGDELWVYDGINTTLAADLYPGSPHSRPVLLAEYQGVLLLTYFSLDYGHELYAFDGSKATLLRDLFPGITDSSITANNHAIWENKFYFSASNSGSNQELWVYDGNSVTLAQDILPGTSGSFPNILGVVNNQLYLSADTQEYGQELLSFDGNKTSLVVDVNNFSSANYYHSIAFNNKFYFAGNFGQVGNELLVSDGKTISLAVDIEAGSVSSYPKYFTEYNGKVYFSAVRRDVGRELFSFDGNTVSLVADINSGAANDSHASDFGVYNGKLYFKADNGTGYKLMAYDGNTITIIDSLSSDSSRSAQDAVVYQNKLYFEYLHPTYGSELFAYDEQTNTIQLVVDLMLGSANSSPQNFFVANNLLYFRAEKPGTFTKYLYVFDGSSVTEVTDKISGNGLIMTETSYAELNGELYFGAREQSNNLGYELWKVTGSGYQAELVQDLVTGTSGSYPSNFITYNNRIFFNARDNQGHPEFWQYDGNTVSIFQKTSTVQSYETNPTLFTLVDKQLFFFANDNTYGNTLFRYQDVLLTGIPSTQISEGQSYHFQPNSAGTGTLIFSIKNKPSWAGFDTNTGALTGTVTQADAGTYNNVEISVTNGQSSATLAAFNISVKNINDEPTGTVTISGLAQENQRLIATSTLADKDGLGSISYSWYRANNKIATGNSYLLITDDIGHSISVKASYTDSFGTNEVVDSLPTATVTGFFNEDFDGDGLTNQQEITLGTDYNNPDSDGDNVNDGNDAFPLNRTEWLDTDQDGIGNNTDIDDDNDGVPDITDVFPLDATESVDTDSDGIGNNRDTDDDNDNVPDSSDAFPLDATESVDTDGDGIGNNADTDDDNDNVPDSSDAFPLDASESVDTDNDGIGNNTDTDDDNDNVPDSSDAFPLDARESVDTDGDGIGNNADTDDDNDGIIDSLDAEPLNNAVGDTIAPKIADIENLVVEATGEFTPLSLTAPTVTDNNLNAPTIASNYQSALPLGDHTIIWTATDYANNQTTKNQLVSIVDTTAPTFDSLPPLKINAQGRYTKLSDSLNVSAQDVVDGDIKATTTSNESLLSGRYDIALKAKDKSDNIASANLIVDVLPELSLNPFAFVEEGGTVELKLSLSDKPPAYPVTATVDLVINDQVVETISLSINSGLHSVSGVVLSNGQINDEVNFKLVTASNSFIGSQDELELELTNDNIAPNIDIIMLQDGKVVSIIDRHHGPATIKVLLSDINSDDLHQVLVWQVFPAKFIEVNESNGIFSFEIDPKDFADTPPIFSITAREKNTQELLGINKFINIVIRDLAPLADDVDSDDDGIFDSVEGYIDSDNDGIADFLDNDSNVSRLPIADQRQSLSVNPSLKLSLGSWVQSIFGGNSRSVVIDSALMQQYFNAHSSGSARFSDPHFNRISPIYDFIVEGLIKYGESTAIIIPLPENSVLPANAIYRKYSAIYGWQTFVENGQNSISSAVADASGNCPKAGSNLYQKGLNQGDNCIQLMIQDGGPNDADRTANGVIEDPGVITTTLKNRPPVIEVANKLTFKEESLLIIDASSSSDFENDPLNYRWRQIKGVQVKIANSKAAILSFTTPAVTANEALVFELTLDDGIDSVSTQVEVIVEQVNKAPTAIISTSENDGVTRLNAQAKDHDGDVISYHWQQLSGPAIKLNGDNTNQASFIKPDVSQQQVIKIQLTVSDGQLQHSETVEVTVTPLKNSGGGAIIWLLILLISSIKIRHYK